MDPTANVEMQHSILRDAKQNGPNREDFEFLLELRAELAAWLRGGGFPSMYRLPEPAWSDIERVFPVKHYREAVA